MAQIFSLGINPWQNPRQGGSRECRFDRLQAFEPLRKVRHEAGVTEYFDEKNEQFQCTGTLVIRRIIEPQGLLLPLYSNTPGLVYIIQGSCDFLASKNFIDMCMFGSCIYNLSIKT